jgi:hypothetical protein
MTPLPVLLVALVSWWPSLALAQEAVNASYRGIGSIYYTFIWAILCYGLYGTFGKKAMYIGAPILAIAAYLALPAS